MKAGDVRHKKTEIFTPEDTENTEEEASWIQTTVSIRVEIRKFLNSCYPVRRDRLSQINNSVISVSSVVKELIGEVGFR